MTGADDGGRGLGDMDLLGALASGHDPAAPRRAPGPASERDDAPPGDVVCSRRGCTAPAVWALEWNNPRVHAPDRLKTWTACDAHREHLTDFLASRGFLRRTRPLAGAAPTPTASEEDRA